MVWEGHEQRCLHKRGPCLPWTCCRETPMSLLPLPAVTSTRRRGGSSGSSPAGEEPGGVSAPAFPAPAAPQEMHFKMMHFTSTSSRGTFLLSALPERNCVSPGRLWGSKPFSISSCPTACQSQCGPSLQRPGLSLLFHPGGVSCPGNITIPEKARFSVPLCSFVLA